MPRRSTFLILFEGRAGSTYLQGLLQSHPRIEAKGEHLGYLRSNGASQETQVQWARSYLRSRHAVQACARGFKTKLRDVLDPPSLAGAIGETAPVVICLTRDNSLKRGISTLNSHRLRRDDWTIQSSDRTGKLTPPPR